MAKGIRSFSFSGFSYAHFGWFGRAMLRVFGRVSGALEAGNIRIHPETYLSMCGFAFTVSLAVFGSLSIIGFIIFGPIMLTLLLGPPLVLIIFLLWPYIAASNRGSSLDTEVPFAAAYVSVLASGGISPFKAFEKLKDIDFLPQLSTSAKLVYVDTKARGIDPVTALEENAKKVPSKDYKEFILGYASTLRVGGDTEHYLLKRTETMFESRMLKMKMIGERMALVMESYITVAILLALSLYIMFIVSRIMPTGMELFGVGTFVLFSYIFLPVISGAFLYVVDIVQPKYPISDWRPYKWLLATVPLMIVLLIPMVASYFVDIPLGPLQILRDFVSWLRGAMNLDVGFDPGIGLAVSMMISFTPAMISEIYYARQDRAMTSGITNFLRDLVEIRKTGISPEKCIFYLSKREYGRFSSVLKIMSNQISWGISFRRVMSDLRTRIHGWLNLMSLFLLIDSIDVGGGTPETLESLATFSESIMAVEKEKQANLRPLIFLPYIGSITLLLSTIVILFFARSIFQTYSAAFGFSDFVKIFVPPIIFNNIFLGLVSGKVSGEKISAGFKHAFILLLVSLIALYIAPMLMGSFQVIPT